MSKIGHCLDNRFTDGGQDANLTRRQRLPRLTTRKLFWYLFLLEAEQTPAPWCGWKDYVLLKNVNGLIGIRTREIGACSIANQPPTLPRQKNI
jgi:hypothetical protein